MLNLSAIQIVVREGHFPKMVRHDWNTIGLSHPAALPWDVIPMCREITPTPEEAGIIRQLPA
jgi:hypothetical protein